MRRIADYKTARAAACAAIVVCSPSISSADEPVIIRGDTSRSLLSEVPAAVNSSPEIYSIQPRLTARDVLTSILGNAELFVSASDGDGALRLEAVDADFENLQKKQSGVEK